MTVAEPRFIMASRVLRENWEDREYEFHTKRLRDIANRKSKYGIEEDNREKFPHLYNKYHSNQSSLNSSRHNIQNNSHQKTKTSANESDEANNLKTTTGEPDSMNDKSKPRAPNHQKNPNLDNWNPEYDQIKNRAAYRSKFRNEVDIENQRLKKKITTTKGNYDFKKIEKDFEKSRAYLRLNEKKFYTPRGTGHRKFKSDSDLSRDRKNRSNKSSLKLLNDALNKQERGDVVLMKTLCRLNYNERMSIKEKYEETYETDLKKGLIKVMDKQYEPLINALLTDTNTVDVDKIYESLYDQNEAATFITESIISRNEQQRKSLLSSFHSKIDSDLKTEINNKIEGDLKQFLLALIENPRLDSDKSADEKRVEADIKELKKEKLFTSYVFLNNVLKKYSKKELNHFFKNYSTIAGEDLYAKADNSKSIVKAVKLVQSHLNSTNLFKAEKLQKVLKSNKPEFLRLIAFYPQVELDEIIAEFNKKYNTVLDQEIKENFSSELSRLILKMLHKNVKEDEEY